MAYGRLDCRTVDAVDLLVGSTLLKAAAVPCTTWGFGASAPAEVRRQELPLEMRVSAIIRMMPFLWIEVDDAPGPQSLRGYLERNAIGLLSNFAKPQFDPPSPAWRGVACDRGKARVRDSQRFPS